MGTNTNIMPNSFVAISDFHSYEWPLDKVINHYIYEYETIYILGDAIDRGPEKNGEGGIELLLKIKELAEKYEGRIIYIPGNHDNFLYGYGCHNDELSLRGLKLNEGIKTYEDFEKLKKQNPLKAENLLNWLGKLPIQRTHEYNDQKYALAHAFFNQKLYNLFPRVNLSDLFRSRKGHKIYEAIYQVLWFRQGDYYNPANVPSKDIKVIIGHTPLKYREGKNLDLKNSSGEQVSVYCVDGGISYEGVLLKYDGGSIDIPTEKHFHNDTSIKSKADKENDELDSNIIFEQEELLKEIIVSVIKNTSSKTIALLLLQKYYLTGDNSHITLENNLNIMAKALSHDIIHNILMRYTYNRDGVIKNELLENILIDYINETLLDYIIFATKERFGNIESVIGQFQGLFMEEDYTYITEKIANARTIAKKLGIPAMKDVVAKNHFSNIADYINNKLKNNIPMTLQKKFDN